MRAGLRQSLILLLTLATWLGIAAAQDDAAGVPLNAHMKSHRGGWDCDRGFRQSGSGCVALVLPANAHIGYSGNDWTCNRGYRRRGESCIPNER